MSPLLNAATDLRVGGATPSKVMHMGVDVWNGGGVEPPVEPDTTFWYSFEGGSAGSAVTTGDAGSGTPFDNVSFPFTTYSIGAKTGSLCGQLATGAAVTSYMQWNGAANALHTFGFWVKIAQMPTGDTRLCDLRDTPSSGTVGGVLLRSTGVLRVMVGSSGAGATDSPALSTGQWYWVSFSWDAVAKTARLRVHNEALTLIHDTGDYAVTSSYTAPQVARIGRVTTAGELGATLFDDMQFNVGSAVPLDPWVAL